MAAVRFLAPTVPEVVRPDQEIAGETAAYSLSGLLGLAAVLSKEFASTNLSRSSLPKLTREVMMMATIDDLAALVKDENANQKIRDLILRLGIFVGLEFEEARWGKRPVRRLRRGVIAFGEDNLPVPIHGRSRADCLPQTPPATAAATTLTQPRRVAGHRQLTPVPP